MHVNSRNTEKLVTITAAEPGKILRVLDIAPLQLASFNKAELPGKQLSKLAIRGQAQQGGRSHAGGYELLATLRRTKPADELLQWLKGALSANKTVDLEETSFSNVLRVTDKPNRMQTLVALDGNSIQIGNKLYFENHFDKERVEPSTRPTGTYLEDFLRITSAVTSSVVGFEYIDRSMEPVELMVGENMKPDNAQAAAHLRQLVSALDYVKLG